MEWPWDRRRREREEAAKLAKKVASDLAMKRVHQRSEEIRREREQQELLARTVAAEKTLDAITRAALEQSLVDRHALCMGCDSVGKGFVMYEGQIMCPLCMSEVDTDEEVIEVFELGSATPVTFRVKRPRKTQVTDDDLEYVRRSLGLEGS